MSGGGEVEIVLTADICQVPKPKKKANQPSNKKGGVGNPVNGQKEEGVSKSCSEQRSLRKGEEGCRESYATPRT